MGAARRVPQSCAGIPQGVNEAGERERDSEREIERESRERSFNSKSLLKHNVQVTPEVSDNEELVQQCAIKAADIAIKFLGGNDQETINEV